MQDERPATRELVEAPGLAHTRPVTRLLGPLYGIFHLWMLYDCRRRRAAWYWYPIILLPGGELVYFLKVKLPDLEFQGWSKWWARVGDERSGVQELRARLADSPSVMNKLALAQGLYDDDAFAEAAELFEQVLDHDAQSRDALYGLGLCHFQVKDFAGAIDPLTQLVEQHSAHADYEGWAKLAAAYDALGQRESELGLQRALNVQVELNLRNLVDE